MIKACIKDILNWYSKNKRDLPWRCNHEPYYVWISEIMLQQTRIEAVIDYFHRFIKTLPTIEDLAMIKEEDLLKLWEGLGYYNRAKNLKKSAEIIVRQYHGLFPKNYDELIKLPGIGDYTASAISSICYNEKKSTIDGNVFRVYTRFYNDFSNISQLKTKRKIKEELEKIMPFESGDFNQALMEIGEVLCIPKGTPYCRKCPLNKECLARKNKNYDLFPIKNKQKEKKSLEYTVLLFHYKNRIAICKRTSKSLLNQLWEFPNIEGTLNKKETYEYLLKQNIPFKSVKKCITNTHIFTHQIWNMISYYIELENLDFQHDFLFLELFDIQHNYAIPKAFHPFLKELISESKNKTIM